MSLAIEFEAKSKQTQEKGGINRSVFPKTSLEEPKSSYLSAATSTNQKAPLRVTDSEKQARFNRGECFRCGEKYGPGHRCKSSTLQLMEAADQNPNETLDIEEEDAEVAEISLHAIMGVPHHATLIVPGSINSTKVSILIDCGSTHNFIHDSLIPKVGLSALEITPFGVRIGNGDIIRCSQICKDVRMQLTDLQITQDLYPFSLGGADVVLGIQWLATLNTVKANWKEMFLKFTNNGKDYKLQGKPPEGKHSACFRHFTIEPIDSGSSWIRHTRLEGKSILRAGSIDTTPAGGNTFNFGGDPQNKEVGESSSGKFPTRL